ncbi:MAG: hypothetical protein ACI8VC_001703 [Candidatus Endobugula sp.]|jgi:hypothetical protein
MICRDFHVNFEVEALALKLKTKQLATDATSSLSGDQRLPCPSNSNGAVDAIDSNPSHEILTSPSGLPVRLTVKWCGKAGMVILQSVKTLFTAAIVLV